MCRNLSTFPILVWSFLAFLVAVFSFQLISALVEFIYEKRNVSGPGAVPRGTPNDSIAPATISQRVVGGFPGHPALIARFIIPLLEKFMRHRPSALTDQ